MLPHVVATPTMVFIVPDDRLILWADICKRAASPVQRTQLDVESGRGQP